MEEKKDCATCRHYKDAGLTEWFECDRDPDKYECIRKFDIDPCEKYEARE